ncbi:hypothetical protein BCR33DRAFT_818967 [Rhizoclosmatium globosum]|uniref:Uncharacterized protein n=1 Tax=Rhizoclosmatium globosum TaxID=329046 RepID=A0A1Y2CB98_9FUNG|nr:hypothetical protein BCR33DRAFT_818967 [Rhizoclosmatium globosum]|eukprot:ORY43605.1 hypothetical protein BCR33DRAFT_818967 [Rhizoclosmatium globosum]
MDLVIFVALATCVVAQQNPYVAQLNALRDNIPSLAKQCFTGLDALQTGNTTLVASYCQESLIQNFNLTNPSNCFASYTAHTGLPQPSASSYVNPKRDAGSSTAYPGLFVTTSDLVISLCFSAINGVDSDHFGDLVNPLQPPSGSNQHYAGNSTALVGFVTASKLNLDLDTLIKSLVQVSVSLKNNGIVDVPGMTLTGGSSSGVVLQILAEGFLVSYIGGTSNSSASINNGTIGTGTVTFTFDASVSRFWLEVSFYLEPTQIVFVNVFDYKSQLLMTHTFGLKALRRRARDANLQLIIGAAPILTPTSAPRVSSNTNTIFTSSITSLLSIGVFTASQTPTAHASSISTNAASTQVSTNTASGDSGISTTLRNLSVSTVSTVTSASTTDAVKATVKDQSKASIATVKGQSTIASTTDNFNIKLGSAKRIRTLAATLVVVSLFLV